MRSPPRKNLKPPWPKGKSANPAGRPKGSKNPSTKLRELIDVVPILKALQKSAGEGDVQAARTLLERALPVYRTTAQPVTVPGLDAAATLTDKARVVLGAVANGSLAPDLGAQLVQAIGNVSHVAEIDELLRRIEALENHKQEGSKDA